MRQGPPGVRSQCAVRRHGPDGPHYRHIREEVWVEPVAVDVRTARPDWQPHSAGQRDVRRRIVNPTAWAHETSLIVALFRRLVGFLPYVDDYADWLPIPYHFKFVRNSTVLGTHRRKWWAFPGLYTLDSHR